jgi:hypothetical protein
MPATAGAAGQAAASAAAAAPPGTQPAADDYSPDAAATRPNAALAPLIRDSGVAGNAQASFPVGDFSPDEVQRAFDTSLAFLTTAARSAAITSPGPGFASDTALRTAMTDALSPWMTAAALKSAIDRSVQLTRVPVADRTADLQSWYAVFPTALCQGENASCLLSDGTEWEKPVISGWEGPAGQNGLSIASRHFYVANVRTYADGEDTGIQRLRITVKVTVRMVPGPGGWQVAEVDASDVGLGDL